MSEVELKSSKKTKRKLKLHRTDGSFGFTPHQIASRWGWHVESVRRAIRERRFASIIISRRRLVPVEEIHRVESEGLITRAN